MNYVHNVFNYADKDICETSELSFEVPGEEMGDLQVEPHEEEEEEYMRMAIKEAENSPDKRIQVHTITASVSMVTSKYDRSGWSCYCK